MLNMSFYHRNYDKTYKMASKLLCTFMLCILVPNILAENLNLEHSSDNLVSKNIENARKVRYNTFDPIRDDDVDYKSEKVDSYDALNDGVKKKSATDSYDTKDYGIVHDNISDVVSEKNGEVAPFQKEESDPDDEYRNNKKKRRHGGKRNRHFDDKDAQDGDRDDWRDGDFVMTDVLGDGEREKRIRYMGISAKETTAGSNGNGLLLRQLTDGRHFIQVIADLSGKIIDCEYVHEKIYINDFLTQFNEEITARGASHDSKTYGKLKKYKNNHDHKYGEGKKYKYREAKKDYKNKKYLMKNKKLNFDIHVDDYNLNRQYERNGHTENYKLTKPYSLKNHRVGEEEKPNTDYLNKYEGNNDDILEVNARQIKDGIDIDDNAALTNENYNSDVFDRNNRDKRSLENGREHILRDFKKEADYYTDLYNNGAWNDFNGDFNEDSEEDFQSEAKESFRELNSNESKATAESEDKLGPRIRIPLEFEYNEEKHVRPNKRSRQFNNPNELGHDLHKHVKLMGKMNNQETKRKKHNEDFQTYDEQDDKTFKGRSQITGYDDEFIERTYNGFKNRPRISPRKSFDGLYNVTILKLGRNSLISKDLFDWLDYAELERKCDAVHSELSKKLGITDSHKGMDDAQNGKSRSRRSLRQFAMMPGTLWCGSGQIANTNAQLGELQDTDVCCRAHDACPGSVPAFHRASGGVINKMPYSLSKCECDRRFRSCLKLANTDSANMVGQLFFNVVQTKCFVLKPAKVCLERSWWGKCSQVGYAKMAHLRDNLRY